MKSLPCFLLAILALVGLSSARADQDGKIGVDVVMDFFPAGKKLPIPTAENPTYYVPIPFGLESSGPPLAASSQPTKTPEQVENLIARTLAAQNYLLMTKTGHPSMVLTIKWGYKAPMYEAIGDGKLDPENPVGARDGQNLLRRTPSSLVRNTTTGFALVPIDPWYVEMSDLVGGQLTDIAHAAGTFNYADRELARLARRPRWYIQITAVDFNGWLRHQKIPLWRANISTEMWHHELDEVIPTMLEAAGPLIGRPMSRPQVSDVALETSPGWIRVGKPVVVSSSSGQPVASR